MYSSSTESNRLNTVLFILAIILIVAGVRIVLIDLYAAQTPYWDDWMMGAFLSKSVSEGLVFSDFFTDANEHRLVFNRVLSVLIFDLNHQQWDPKLSMIANTLIWAATAAFFFRLVIKHIDIERRPLLFFVLFILFVFPVSLVNILWGIQTHTYTMILFSVWGCWYTTYRALSKKWWFGIASLAAASLTLAGGTFAAFGVVGVKLLSLIVDKENRRDALISLIAAGLAGGFGLAFILVQPGSSSAPAALTLSDAISAFLKTMSWPYYPYAWPAFILAVPVILLLIQYLRRPHQQTQLSQFALSVFGFALIIALAIAYARGVGGHGPARRYFEFMTLIPIVSLMSFLLLRRAQTGAAKTALSGLLVAWLAIFVLSFPWHHSVVTLTLKERGVIQPAQERLTRTYLNTRDPETLENQPFQHVPFPRNADFITILDEMNEQNTLPALLQAPKAIEWRLDITAAEREESAFMVNGTFIASQGKFKVNRLGEDVFGSYKPRAGGMEATGRFESDVIRIDRSFAAIPFQGYLGYPGLELKLVDVGSGEEFNIAPEVLDSKFNEYWRMIYMPVPRGYYRLVATDNNPQLWFGFATPRSVGRLSYYVRDVLEHGHWLWKIGLLLLLVSCRTSLLKLVNGTPRLTS